MSTREHHTPARTPGAGPEPRGGHGAHTHDPADGRGPAGHTGHQAHTGHGGHGWMMIACCIPMLIIAIVLVATGIVSPSFILVALACTAMMALMMRGMHDDSGGGGHGGHS